MSGIYYDLHIHSCLSPCGDDDMTPQNIVGMATLKGIGIIALTDHNTTANCATFMKVAEEYGICAVPGMELTTTEEIHMLCLFPDLATAQAFESIVDKNRIRFPNKPHIFGHQYAVGIEEEMSEPFDFLLSAATMITADEAVKYVREMGGFICPAHVDRPANGMIGVLGTVPPDYGFSHIEYNNPDLAEQIRKTHNLEHTLSLFDSDAHNLGNIAEPCHKLQIDIDSPNAMDVIRYLHHAGNFTTYS